MDTTLKRIFEVYVFVFAFLFASRPLSDGDFWWHLKTGDYIVDEKHKTVNLTETGMAKAEKMLAHRLQPGGLYDPVNMKILHHVNQALRAHALFHLDVEYMVKDNEGHSLARKDSQVEFYSRSARFLEKHLGMTAGKGQ